VARGATTRSRWFAQWAVAVMVGLGGLATLLAIAVIIHPGPLPGDLAIVKWWQRFGEPVPTIAEWVRLTTSTEANLIVAAIPAWFVVHRYGRLAAAAVAIGLVTMLVAQPLVKEVVDRPRPTPDQVDVRADYSSMSFPSGHSMSTMAVWGVAVLVAIALRRSRVAVVLAVPIALTSVASLVQGVHWPSDSLAGLMLGAISAIASATLLLSARDRAQEQQLTLPS
jgi:undecaprenyl-diphosphatase